MEDESPFYRTFLAHLCDIVEPRVDVFPNAGNPLCLPFMVWERKTDAESSLYKAQNQLSLPLVKSLDILAAVGLKHMPVFGLVSLGYKWELYVGYLRSPPKRKEKVCYFSLAQPTHSSHRNPVHS